jgi:hypothetical protein
VSATSTKEELKDMSEFIKILQSNFQLNIIVILTKCDIVIERGLPNGAKAKMSQVYENVEIRNVITEFSKILDIRKEDFFPLANFVEIYNDKGRDLAK